MAFKIDDISINTIIGGGSAIQGNIKVNGFIRVDGDIDGNLDTDGNIIIGENARIRGNVNAKAIIVGGIILGDVFANESVKLLSKAAVVGDIVTHKVQIDDNALFHGNCIAVKDDEEYTRLSSEFLQSKAIKQKAAL